MPFSYYLTSIIYHPLTYTPAILNPVLKTLPETPATEASRNPESTRYRSNRVPTLTGFARGNAYITTQAGIWRPIMTMLFFASLDLDAWTVDGMAWWILKSSQTGGSTETKALPW